MRSLPPAPFAGDAGEADAQLDAALAAYRGGRVRASEVLAALSTSRLLVPVVALLGEAETTPAGLQADKSADIAAVLLQRPDGRKALLAFTSLTRLQAWKPDARPVPVSIADAARSALHDGAAALVIDVAGPVMFVVEQPDLDQLAAGRKLVPWGTGHAWAADA